jgi:hypothetical protein
MKYILLLLLIACSKPALEANTAPLLKDIEIGHLVKKGSVISLYADSLGEWIAPIEQAIIEWNELGTSLRFSWGTKTNHTTYIKFAKINSTALAYMPDGKGNPGDSIIISYDAKYQKRLIILHEIGHLIGLMHIESRISVMNTKDRYGFQKEDSLLIYKLF